MDPDCAICHAPANMRCDCEAKGLEVAVRQAEMRAMKSVYDEIRTWVRGHAQDYILEYFRLLTERRKAQHSQHMERITAHAFRYYHGPPPPHEIAAAQAGLKRGIDEDWQASVQRYPEVLEYFYGLVEFSTPHDSDPTVKDPPLSALTGGTRKGNRRNPAVPSAAESMYERERIHRARTPPVDRMGSRTPGYGPPLPSGTRRAYRPPTAPPTSVYFGGGPY